MFTFPQVFQFANIDVLEISHSSMSAFYSCARKFEFRKFHQCSRKEESLPMMGGTAMHIALQDFLVHRDADKGLFELLMAFDMRWQESGMKARSLEAYIGTYLEAIKFNLLDEYEIAKIKRLDGSVSPAIEVPFAIEIQNFPWGADGKTITVRYVGRIDFIVYNKFTDSYMVWDLKTTTKDVDMDAEFRFDTQCLPYGLVLEELLERDYSTGFQVAYWVTKVDALAPLNKYYSYMKDQQDIQDWLKSFMITLHDIKRYWEMGWFPRNGNACSSWNRKCTFFDLCETRNPKTINALLDSINQGQEKYKNPEPWLVLQLDAGGFANE